MKSIKLQNQDLTPATLFLKSLSVNGKATRGKQKFIERLIEKNKEYATQEQDILKPYCRLDESGELIVLENGAIEFKEDTTVDQKEQLVKDREELNQEDAEISFVEHSSKYEALFQTLENWESPIEPEYSFIYDKLMDQYELNEEEK